MRITTALVVVFLATFAAFAHAQSRAVLGANDFARVEPLGGNWVNLKWNEEGPKPGISTGPVGVEDQERPVFFEDDDGLHMDSAPSSSGFPAVWVDETGLWNVHVEATFTPIVNPLIQTATREIRIMAGGTGSPRLLSLSAAEPENPNGQQHVISLKWKGEVFFGEAIVVQVRAVGVSVFTRIIAKGVVLAVWVEE